MKYSIITINFNHREGLRRTIESVITQSYNDYEYIIIDGGSTDGSREVIQEYEKQIHYWVSEPDKGIYNAMNKGVKAAHGDYLIFMNSGDTFFDNNVLEKSLPYMHDDIVQGIARNQDQTETPLFFFKVSNRTDMVSPSLHHQSCFFRKKLFDSLLYDEHYKIVADWKFYIEQLIFHNCTYSHMPVRVALYEGGGVSETAYELEFEERREIIQEMAVLLKEKGQYGTHEELMQHLKFTSKQRFLLNKKIMDAEKYMNYFPESNGYYKFYSFNSKQKFLFFLADHRMIHLLKALTKFLKK